MGDIIEIDFSNSDKKRRSPEPERKGLVSGELLGPSIQKIDELMGREYVKGHSFPINISNSEKPNISLPNGREYYIGIRAPLDWIMDISNFAANERKDRDLAELFQVYALTAVYAKHWLNKLDGEHKLNLETKTTYNNVKIDYHNSRDIQLWQVAYSIALRAVTVPKSDLREQLPQFLDSLRAEEVKIELKGQDPNSLCAFDGYKIGFPMSCEELLDVSPLLFMKAANS